jgi:photosynthetic reaction center cytochrome c subunit
MRRHASPAVLGSRTPQITPLPRRRPGGPRRRSVRGGLVVRRLMIAGVTCTMILLVGCEPTESVQWGYRGSSMIQVYNPKNVDALKDINAIPEPEVSDPYDPTFPMATEIHENIQVLTDLNALEIARLMNAMVTWIAPEEGCAYCHNPENLAEDSKYTKHVARRMLQMTRNINANWSSHVADTGVTCWTCHRGQAVPSETWFEAPELPRPSARTSGFKGDQNLAGVSTNGYSSLPFDPLSTFLVDDTNIRVQGTEVLPHGNRQSNKQTEYTYSLMMYMSKSLGVNCTYCHHTRAMGAWDQSTPQRVTAWYGIRMVRELNSDYLIPLEPQFPEHRLGPNGDGPKLACATCHKGTYKPLYGETMLVDYPSLRGVLPGRLSPDPTEGGKFSVAIAPEGVQIATMDERVAAFEAMTAAAAEAEIVLASVEGDASPADQPASEPTAEVVDMPTEQASAATGDDTGPADATRAALAQAGQDATLASPGEGAAPRIAAAVPLLITAASSAISAASTPTDAASDDVAPKWQGLWRFQEAGRWALDEVAGPLSADGTASALQGRFSPFGLFLAKLDAATTPSGLTEDSGARRWQGLWRFTDPSLVAFADAGLGSTDQVAFADLPALAAVTAAAVPSMSADVGAPRWQGFNRILVDARDKIAALVSDAGDAPRGDQVADATGTDGVANAEAQPGETLTEQATAEADAAETLALTVEDLRNELAATAERLAAAEGVRPALDLAEGRILAMRARLDNQTTALNQQLEVVREQRDAALEAAEAAAAEVATAAETAESDASSATAAVTEAVPDAAALETLERRLQAADVRLAQERLALNQQLEVVRTQRDAAQSEAESRVAAREHSAVKEASARQITALGARLDQNREALSQQLEVVRGQRDQLQEQLASLDDSVDRRTYETALAAADRRAAALETRLAQNVHALGQQLDVVRAQRDEANEIVASLDGSVDPKTHAAVVADAERRMDAMQTRLDQNVHALGQQLDVVRAQRDDAQVEIASLTETMPTSLVDADASEVDADAEQRIRAWRTRLEQQVHALEQQLEVVRAERDEAAVLAEARIDPALHRAKVTAAEGRIRALQARLDQNTHALAQQLDVVRAQRSDAIALADARVPMREHAAALAAADRQAGALTARLEQQTHALNQQLVHVRDQRDGAVAEKLARIPRGDHEKKVASLEARLTAQRARLDQTKHALVQQLEVVRDQRDQAGEVMAQQLAALERKHERELAKLERNIAARDARLAQQGHALRQQLAVVREQRGAAEADAELRLTELERQYEAEIDAMEQRVAAVETRLTQERNALEQQLAVVREQRDQQSAQTAAERAELAEKLAAAQAELAELRGELQVAASEHQAALAAAESSASEIRTLYDNAEALGGEVTDDGIVVNLGGDRLRFASGSAALPNTELPDLDRAAELLAERPELWWRVSRATPTASAAPSSTSPCRNSAPRPSSRPWWSAVSIPRASAPSASARPAHRGQRHGRRPQPEPPGGDSTSPRPSSWRARKKGRSDAGRAAAVTPDWLNT